ncbi:MAG: hypothetical protein JXR73_02475 [Candidatus Omnitrophica bacterium]|nr:hypothetical protein [Candidatus Omnitrophota bacterium]
MKDKVRMLALGLNQSEKDILVDLNADNSRELIFSNTDMDMWDHADHEKYDLCIIGQNEGNQDLDYAAWLLKGIIKPSQIIVISDQYSWQERSHLRKHRIRFYLGRPLDPELLSHAVEKVILYNKPWYKRLISAMKLFV